MGKKQDDFSSAILQEHEGRGRIKIKEVCKKTSCFIKITHKLTSFVHAMNLRQQEGGKCVKGWCSTRASAIPLWKGKARECLYLIRPTI
jgi:hypothetical protein